MQPRSRLASLDALRGLAAVTVALFHFYTLQNGLPSFNFGHTAVCVFFVLSGFVIVQAIETRSIAAFAWGRFWRLYPAHTVAILLIIGLVSIVEPESGLSFTSSKTLASLSLVPYLFGTEPLVVVSWTLQVEIAWYVLAALLSHVRLDWRLVGVVVLGLSLTGVPFIHYLVLMVIGVLSYQARKGRSSWGWVVAIWAIYSLIGPATRSLAPAFFLAALLWRWRIPRLLLWFGERSYSLYLVHNIFFPVGRVLSFGYPSLFFVAWMFFTLITTHVVYMLVEQPSLRLSKYYPLLKGATISKA